MDLEIQTKTRLRISEELLRFTTGLPPNDSKTIIYGWTKAESITILYGLEGVLAINLISSLFHENVASTASLFYSENGFQSFQSFQSATIFVL